MQQESPLLTVPELADYCRVPVSTIRYWRNHRQGPPAIRLGKKLAFRVSDVDTWLAEQVEESE